jgi:hypothetical protein
MTSSPATQQQLLLQLQELQEPAHSKTGQVLSVFKQHKQQLQVQTLPPQAAASPPAQASAILTSKHCMQSAWLAYRHKQQAGSHLMTMLLAAAGQGLAQEMVLLQQGQATGQQQQGQAAGLQHQIGSHSSWAATTALGSRCLC